MEQNSLPPIGVFVGVGVVIVAVFGFLLSSLVMGGTHTTDAATVSPLATQPPAATKPIARAPTATPVSTPPPSGIVAPTPTLISPQVPQIAPDFTLERANGDPLTLSEQLTKGPVVLVLMQSGGGWQPNPQLGELQGQLEAIRASGAEVVVVVSASIERVEGWCQTTGVDYPMLADPEQTVSRAYGMYNLMGAGVTMPSAFIIDTDRNILWYSVGAHTTDYVRAQVIVDNLP